MNDLVRVQGGLPVGTQQGNWTWDGTNWVCSPCGTSDGGGQFPFCPPPGFPPAGCPPWFSGMNSPPWYPGANAGVSFGNTAPMNAVRGHFWWNGLSLAMFDGAVWVNTSTGQIVPPGGGGGVTPPPPSGSVIISSTAPGNPFIGMQWWDGSVMRVWDGTTWNIVGPGTGVGPVPTTTRVFAIAAPQNLTLGGVGANYTSTIVPFTSSPTIDTLLGWNATTRMWKPTKGGIYMIMGRAQLLVNAGGVASITVARNDQGEIDPSTEVVANAYLGVSIPAQEQTMSTIAGMVLMNGSTDFLRLWALNNSTGIFPASGNIPVFSAYLLP